MTEREEVEHSKVTHEFRTNRELRELALERAATDLFFDPNITHIDVRNIDDWKDLFPELARKFVHHLKAHSLESLSITYKNRDYPQIDEASGDDDESVSWEDENEAGTIMQLQLLFAREEGMQASEIQFHFFPTKSGRDVELWSFIEEKENVFVERVARSYQGEEPRLKIVHELISYIKGRVG